MSVQDVLVVAEVQRDALADVALELISAARSITAATGGEVIALVLSADGAAYAGQLAAADRVVLINDPLLAAYAPGPYLAAIEEMVAAEKPRAVLIGATSIGWDLAPMLAARLKAPMVVGATAIEVSDGELIVTSSFCGAKMTAEVGVGGAPAVLMVLPGSFRPPVESGKGLVETRTPSRPLEAGAIRFEQFILPQAGDVDITQQDILVAVGRGIQQKENVELAEQLAGVLGGAVCASRPVIDQGWLPATRQVGKSGMTVKPKLYLALGISGAPEHVEGMKNADLIIAVNTDPKAPIFDVADYGVVADILELAPALTEAIQR
mgnify:CR=1 FL=1